MLKSENEMLVFTIENFKCPQPMSKYIDYDNDNSESECEDLNNEKLYQPEFPTLFDSNEKSNIFIQFEKL
jgi:hypothetical protein